MGNTREEGPLTFTPISGYYKEFVYKGLVVAYANLILSNDTVFFVNFEVKDKGTGVGSGIIRTYLKDFDVEGVSVKSAIGFWIKMGATIREDDSFIIKKKGV